MTPSALLVLLTFTATPAARSSTPSHGAGAVTSPAAPALAPPVFSSRSTSAGAAPSPATSASFNAPPATQTSPGAGAAISPAETRPLEVHANATPERVRLGEPFVYEIALRHPKAQRYDLRLPEDLGVFGALSMERHREDGADDATTTFKLKLAVYELGAQKLPDLTFDVAGPAGDARYVLPGAQVEGLSSLKPDDPKSAELLDIRAPVGFEVRTYRLVAWLLALAALAAASVVLARRLWPTLRGARPALPLDARTREALDALEGQGLPQLGLTREFYFALSEIVRGYLGERYGIEALESTSAEVLERLRRVDTPGLPFADLTHFLREADLVKFARAATEPDRCAEALAFARRLVDVTPPLPAGAPDARPALS